MRSPTDLLDLEETVRGVTQAAEEKVLHVMVALVDQYLAGFKIIGQIGKNLKQ